MSQRQAGAARPSSWWTVLNRLVRDKDYRAISISLFVVGLATGLIMPYVALWVTGRLHGSTLQAAFIFVPFGLVGVFVNLIASAYSDRVARRKGVILLSLLVSGAARICLGLVSSYSLAVVLYALTGFGPFAIIFALLRDTIRSKQAAGVEQAGTGAFMTTLVRTMFSLGWLVGPVVGAMIIGIGGYRGLFWTSGLLLLIAALWSALSLTEQRHVESDRKTAARPLRAGEIGLLLLLFLVGLFLLSGDSGRSTFMALYLTRSLRLPVSDVSWTFSATVLAELLFMPLSGRLADRFGVAGIMALGVAAQAVYFFGMGATSSYLIVLLLQVLYAFVVSTSSGVAILFAQTSISEERTGLSTSTYLVSRGLAPLLNSLLVGLSAVAADLGRLFTIFGAFAVAALLIVVLMSRFARREVPSGA